MAFCELFPFGRGGFDEPRDIPIGLHEWIKYLLRLSHGRFARWVLHGNEQRYGIDYKETYAPGSEMCAIRMICIVVASRGQSLQNSDIRGAFLNNDLDFPVYTRQLKGFEEPGKENWVRRVNKSQYGGKQCANLNYKDIDRKMKRLNYKSMLKVPTLYVRMEDTSYVHVHIDDFLYTSSCIDRVKQELSDNFDIEHRGETTEYVGIQFERNWIKREIHLHQRDYIYKILEDFEMSSSAPRKTPMYVGLDKLMKCEKVDSSIPFQKLFGKLWFAVVRTKLEMFHFLSYMSRFSSCFGEEHYNILKDSLRYLKYSINDTSVIYGEQKDLKDLKLVAFSDTDFAGDITDGNSTGGYVLYWGKNLLEVKSQKLPLVTLSSMESEYVQYCLTAQRFVFMGELLQEMGFDLSSKIIFGDNQSAIHFATNEIIKPRTRHIRAKYFFLRDCIEKGLFSLKYIPTTENVADIFTKVLGFCKFRKFKLMLNLRGSVGTDMASPPVRDMASPRQW